MHKLWTYGLAVSVLAGASAGCGSQGPAAPGEQSKVTATAEPAPVAAAPVTPSRPVEATPVSSPVVKTVIHRSSEEPAETKSESPKTAVERRSSGATAAVILPDPDEGPLDGSGPALLGFPMEIEGETFCAKAQLGISESAQLAVRTAANVVYLVDDAATQFADMFAKREQHMSVKVKGVPYVKDGVLHLTASDAKSIR